MFTVHKSEAGTSSVFYYKTGDMLPEDTTCTMVLNINNEKICIERYYYKGSDSRWTVVRFKHIKH